MQKSQLPKHEEVSCEISRETLVAVRQEWAVEELGLQTVKLKETDLKMKREFGNDRKNS